MSYVKQDWSDGSSGNTPLSAARMNHMEDGIAAAVAVDSTGTAAVGQVVTATEVDGSGNPTQFGLRNVMNPIAAAIIFGG